jgi:hypothetical protein
VDRKPCIAEENKSELDQLPDVWQPKAGLGNRRERGNRLGHDRSAGHLDLGLHLADGAGLVGAVARDVAGLAALVASLAGGVEWAAVGGGAVTRDVAELAAGIALHRLRLAVASKVVRAAALVACCRTGSADESAPHGSKAAAGDHAASTSPGDRGVRAVASQMANRIAVVAPVAGAGAAQTERRALGLDVSETLAVVALLRFGGAGHRALVRLVVWLLAVVAEPMRRGAGLGMVAKLTALVARPTRN